MKETPSSPIRPEQFIQKDSAAAAHDHAISIPWGPDARLELDLPAVMKHSRVDTSWPDLEGSMADFPGPRAGWIPSSKHRHWSTRKGRLDRGGRGGRSLALDAGSRGAADRPAAAARGGGSPEDVTISVGVGRHQAVDRGGDATTGRRRDGRNISLLQPAGGRPSAYVDLGTTPRGSGPRVPPGGRGRPPDPDRLGAAAPPGGFRGRIQADLSGDEPPRRRWGPCTPRAGPGGDAGVAGWRRGGEPDATGDPRRPPDWLGPCFSISHLIGRPGQIFRVMAGHPDPVKNRLAAEVGRRFQARPAAPADMVVAGNHPWPGDPMQSFKVLLHHRAACRPGGVLVGFFWTEPDEIDRSFPRSALRSIAATGAPGGWAIRRAGSAGRARPSATGLPAAFMIRWARELVVDRTVLVFAPPLHARIGPRLGPVRLFADQPASGAPRWSRFPGTTANRLWCGSFHKEG